MAAKTPTEPKRRLSGFCNPSLPRTEAYDPHQRCNGCDCRAAGCPCNPQETTVTDPNRTAWEWNHDHPSGTPVLAWPGTRDEEPLRTRTRSSAWPLGDGTVVVSVVGHAGGIALTHIEVDDNRQPAVPDVEFEPPPCPICGTDLDADGDSLTCETCRVSWDSSGGRGEWHDPSAPRCGASRRPLPSQKPDLIERCVYALDHAAPHRPADGLGTWVDTSLDAVTDSAGQPITKAVEL